MSTYAAVSVARGGLYCAAAIMEDDRWLGHGGDGGRLRWWWWCLAGRCVDASSSEVRMSNITCTSL